MITLYGIPNCSTVKKARQHLDELGITYHFHNFKKDAPPEAELRRWIEALGWDKVLNRSGMTWRNTEEASKAEVVDADSALRYLLANSSAIKRPVIDWGEGRYTLGFKPEEWPL